MLFPWNDPLFDSVIFVTAILGILVMISHVALGIGILGSIIHRIRPTQITSWITTVVQKHSLGLATFFSLFATAGSLFFSEIAKYTPCNLCWYQRIIIFPLGILYLVALLRRDKTIFWYTLPLIFIGMSIGIFHYTNQMWNVIDPASAPQLTCGVVGMTPSCSGHWFVEQGYITIPMMALTTLAILLFITIITLRSAHKRDEAPVQ